MPRQSQNQSPAPSRKKALLSAAILLALTGVLILLFQETNHLGCFASCLTP